MKLPRLASANVPREKIKDYLLCPAHRRGGGKAQWFIRAGFSADDWQALARALLQHARENEVVRQEESPFGTRYIVEGRLRTPAGRPLLRAVWFAEQGQESPRLVTAYPLESRR